MTVPQTTVPEEKFFHAQITRRLDFASDLWMFRIRSGGEFNFVPGQFATLGVIDENGKRIERPYSIASAPSESEVEFFFGRVGIKNFSRCTRSMIVEPHENGRTHILPFGFEQPIPRFPIFLGEKGAPGQDLKGVEHSRGEKNSLTRMIFWIGCELPF